MKLAATIVSMTLGLATVYGAPGGETSKAACDFSDLDLENMVEAVTNRLPEKYSPPYSAPGEVLPGLTIGQVVYSNLDKLRPYGAPRHYCREGSRFVQVDLATRIGDQDATADAELRATVPWKYCGGKEGEASSQANAKVTVIFKVVEGSGDNGTKLVHHSGPKFAIVETNWLRLDGAGGILGGVFSSMRLFLPQLPKEFWNALLIFELRNIFREIAGFS